MELQLISTKDAPNIINKTLNVLATIQVRLKSDFDIISPNLVLDITGEDVRKYNYAYFPELQRYYFIEKTANVNNRFWRLYLTCDVLETYKDKILASDAVFTRDIKTGDYVPPSAVSARKIPEQTTSDIELGNTPSILVASIVTKDS